MKSHHIVITGTGRAGTTFLMQILTKIGLDTGFKNIEDNIFDNCNAGMEYDLRNANAPYIVKSPFLCDELHDIILENDLVIDYAIVPVRDLFSAAESRRDVVSRADLNLNPSKIPGGLFHTSKPEDQETVLTYKIYNLIYSLAKFEIPLLLLDFPRIVYDQNYLFIKLKSIFPEIEENEFSLIFNEVSKPSNVHKFEEKNNPQNPDLLSKSNYNKVDYENNTLKRKIENLQNILNQKENIIQHLEAEVEMINNSITFKIGNFLKRIIGH
jgi:hypothetical protein